jgi:hypothetical protein
MRTTLDLDDALLAAAKRRASESGRTLTAFIEAALAAALAPGASRGKPFKLKLITRRGRVLPGIDVADRDSLYDAMEGRR